jgi:RHS repeat-associated protein
VDQLFARITAGTAGWYLTDWQGSVRNIIDNSANLLDTISYDGFGNAAESSPGVGDRYKFGGQFDSETGLQYNRARYYDPKVGRWTSQDPLGFAAGDANLYRYVGNSPTNATDPSGLRRWDDQLKQLTQKPKDPTQPANSSGGATTPSSPGQSGRPSMTPSSPGAQPGSTPVRTTGQPRPQPGPTWIQQLNLDVQYIGDAQPPYGVWYAIQAPGRDDPLPTPSPGGYSAGDVPGALGTTPNGNTKRGMAAVPPAAWDMIKWLDAQGGADKAFPKLGYRGGGPWQNDGRGQVLPRTDGSGRPITYREWDIEPHRPGVNRGARRLVTGSDGSIWYTDDHYKTFTRIH